MDSYHAFTKGDTYVSSGDIANGDFPSAYKNIIYRKFSMKYKKIRNALTYFNYFKLKINH